MSPEDAANLRRKAMVTHPIEESLARAAERCGDLTPFVYARLFEAHPETRPLFARDTTGAVRGEMLARVFETVLDLIGENRYAANMIRCEVVTHSEYDVPPEVFRVFFGVVAGTVRETLAGEWTEAFEAAWRALLADLDGVVADAVAA